MYIFKKIPGIFQVGERNDVEGDIPEGFPECDNFSYEWFILYFLYNTFYWLISNSIPVNLRFSK